ncbi:hypothetical protein FRC02_007014 [Tulasnella sp. 418]|nr:hypothetical protein FRC02_007014 [Tulasnella sp. 418]
MRLNKAWHHSSSIQAYFLDKLYSVAAGLPCAFNDLKEGAELVTTPWPRIMAEYESGYAQIVPYSSLEDLFTPPPRLPEDHIPDIHLATVLKALSLLHRSSKLIVTPKHEEVWEEGKLMYDAIQQLKHATIIFSDRLVANPTDFAVVTALLQGSPGLSEAEILGLDHSVLALVQMMVQVTNINLNRSSECLPSYFDEEHGQYYWHLQRLEAARKTVAIARKLSVENLLERRVPFPYQIIGLLLVPVGFVLVEHTNLLERNESFECQVTVNDAQRDLNFAVGVIRDQARTFPLFEVQLEKLNNLKHRSEGWDNRSLALLRE